jgi:hypothetical protein
MLEKSNSDCRAVTRASKTVNGPEIALVRKPGIGMVLKLIPNASRFTVWSRYSV